MVQRRRDQRSPASGVAWCRTSCGLVYGFCDSCTPVRIYEPETRKGCMVYKRGCSAGPVRRHLLVGEATRRVMPPLCMEGNLHGFLSPLGFARGALSDDPEPAEGEESNGHELSFPARSASPEGAPLGQSGPSTALSSRLGRAETDGISSSDFGTYFLFTSLGGASH